MKMKHYPSVTLCNVLCVILMAVILVLQFTPFWELNGQQVSIGSYIWFPLDHEDLTVHIQETVQPDFQVNSLVISALCQLILPVAGAFLLLGSREGIGVPICAAVCGAATLLGFLTEPVFRMGICWAVYPVLAVLMLAAAVISICVRRNQSEEE